MKTGICEIFSGYEQSRRRPLDHGRSQRRSRQRPETAPRWPPVWASAPLPAVSRIFCKLLAPPPPSSLSVYKSTVLPTHWVRRSSPLSRAPQAACSPNASTPTLRAST